MVDSRRSTLCILVLFLMVLALSLSIFPANSVADSFPHASPFDVVTYAFTPKVTITDAGEIANFNLAIRPHKDNIQTVVVTISGDNISVEGNASTTINFAGSQADVTVPLQYQVNNAGKGAVNVEIITYSANGQVLATNLALIHYNATDAAVFHSTNGSLETEIMELDWLWWNKQLTEEDYLAAKEKILGGGAEQEMTVTSGIAAGVDAQAAAVGDLTISGQIRWTDSAGGTHPVRFATIEIRDDEGGGNSELVSSTLTDASGNYFDIVNNNDGNNEGGRDIFIRVLAQAPAAQVQDNMGNVHRIDSGVNPNVADGSSVAINLTANNVADNNTAFSVLDSMVMIRPYAEYLTGEAIIPSITVRFPFGTGACYNCIAGQISSSQLNRFDWDVLHHEYGHYIAAIYNLDSSPGGGHGFGDNLSERYNNKNTGIRLAWGEGWPTFFGTAGQIWANGAALNIPNVGDTIYTDTEDINLVANLEAGVGLGEDNEVSVFNFLWDLYDTPNDTGDTVSYTDTSIFDVLNAADPIHFSAAYAALINGLSVPQVAAIGCIATQQNIAPRPTEPNNGAVVGGTVTALSWANNGGGATRKSNSFVVEFYDSTFTTLLHTSPTITTANGTVTTASYTPPQTVWDSFGTEFAPIIWIVRGTQTAAPSTGPYTSCPSTFEVDNTPPITSDSLSGIMGNNGWWVSPVTVTLNATDSQSGVAKTTYKINGGSEEIYTSPIVLGVDGIYTIEYRSEDKVGNLEGWKSVEVKIDTTDPETTDDITGTAGLNGWWVSDVYVTLNATDNLSGVAYTVYRIDGGTIQAYTGAAIPFTEDGIFILEYRSEDVAGNLEEWHVIEIKIDTVPPVIDISTDKEVYTRVELIVFDITAYDPEPGSGVWKIMAEFDGNVIEDGSVIDPFWFDLGIYNYSASAQDYAGWISEDGGSIELIATIDSLTPTVERLCNESHIAKHGICNAFLAKINAAKNSIGRGNTHAAINQLNALLHQLNAQEGKALSDDAFRILDQDVRYVIISLGGIPKPAELAEETVIVPSGQEPTQVPVIVTEAVPAIPPDLVTEKAEIVTTQTSEEVPVTTTETVIPPEESDNGEEIVVETTPPPTEETQAVDETLEVVATEAPVVSNTVHESTPAPTVADLTILVQTCISNKGQQTSLLNHIDNGQWDLLIGKLNTLTTNNISAACANTVQQDMREIAIYLQQQ